MPELFRLWFDALVPFARLVPQLVPPALARVANVAQSRDDIPRGDTTPPCEVGGVGGLARCEREVRREEVSEGVERLLARVGDASRCGSRRLSCCSRDEHERREVDELLRERRR